MPATPEFERFHSTKQFGSLDALRAFAIVAVIWQHCPGAPAGMDPFVNPGGSGVSLFFVLSGFLITTLLLREESQTGTINLRNFYIRRSLRIFPLYYAVLALYTVLVLLKEHNAAGDTFLRNLPWYATYTSNWFVDLVPNVDGQRRVIFVFAWSLATEEQFYVVWPSLLRFLKRRAAVAVLVGIAAASFGLRLTVPAVESPDTFADRALRIAKSPSLEICCGVLLAIALNSRSRFPALWSVLGRPWSAPLAAAAALAVTVTPIAPHHVWYAVQAVVFTALIASCVIREDHGLARILTLPFLARIGVVSYGMYLLHSLAVHATHVVLRRAGLDVPVVAFVASAAAAYLAAEVSYRLFEAQFLRLKHRFAAVRPGPGEPGPGPALAPATKTAAGR